MEDKSDSDEDTPRPTHTQTPDKICSVSQPSTSQTTKKESQSRDPKDNKDVIEKSRRITEHVKDAKERFRLAMRTEGERKSLRYSEEDKAEHVTSRSNAQPTPKPGYESHLKVTRGNLKIHGERGHITLKNIPRLNLKSDNEWQEPAPQNSHPNTKESLQLDLNLHHDNPGLSRRDSCANRMLPKPGDTKSNSSPPLTPRGTPRHIKRRDFSYVPTPRRSEDKLPVLSLSAKEDIIKEIAPGLLLRSRDSELTSSRSSVASSASSLRSSVTSVISITELKTLRVSCRVSEDAIVSSTNNSNNNNNTSNNKNSGVTSVITSNMSVTDMKKVLLGRSKVRGVQPANFCVIAVRTLKGKTTETSDPEDEMVQVETEILNDDSHPFEDPGRHLRRTRFSIRPGRGKVVDIYDGRKWPVVRCGSVYITPSDSTTKVVQAVLVTPTVKEKKRRAVKYTVAVGTSHGHVQAFLKDSDVVLGAYEDCPAEEKCLMLIKRPKESSKKLSKAHSGHSLSMSDTQLYRQFDGTAFNTPYSTAQHRMKDMSNPSNGERDPLASEIYSMEPRVRRAGGPAAISAAHRKWPAARPNNTFVPIPELGIYTPEQHVLQNGTYAQHCHLREVNNNSNNNNNATSNRRNTTNGYSDGRGGRYDNNPSSSKPSGARGNVTNSMSASNNSSQLNNRNNNNVNYNSSLNSSFDESVSSYGYAPAKGVLRGYDPAAAAGVPPSGNSRYPSGDVYHSCVDISNTYRESGDDEFNTLSSRRSYDPPRYSPIREQEAGPVRGRARSPVQPSGRRDKKDREGAGYRRNGEAVDEDVDGKMDSGARSFSLGDLSAGLKFSLAGDQKSGSVTAINGDGRKGRGLSSPGLAPKSVRPAPSAASISSSVKEEGSTALRHIRERLQKAVFKSQDRHSNTNNRQATQPPRTDQVREGGGHQYQRRFDSKQTFPQQRQSQAHPHPGTYQRQMSAPEGTQIPISSPRHRCDSQDTISSYKSAQSDNSNFGSGNLNLPHSGSGYHNTATVRNSNNNISNSSNSISSTLNNTDSSGNSFATAKSNTTITNTTELSNGHKSQNQVSSQDRSSASPTKPKRSLPNVPLSETSERIKRFTEMMKSRMSTGSRTGSSNGSRSGSSAKNTPTQRSTDSACSHTSLSRKSSMDTASDSEVFTINNGSGGGNTVKPPQRNGGGNTKQQQQQHQSNNILPNQYPDFNERRNKNHVTHAVNSFNGVKHDDQNALSAKGFAGQGQGHQNHRSLTSEDTPLPPGDRSTDSGQTTGTNQSYNGSAMDSGYTTNNDADNDSFNTPYTQQQQQQHQYLQHHHHFQSIEPQHLHRHQHQDYLGHAHPSNHHQHHQPQQQQQHRYQTQHHHHPQQQPQSAVSPPHNPGSHPQYSYPTSRPQQGRSGDGFTRPGLPPPPHPDQRLVNLPAPQVKPTSNLANARRFGSVQNVSSAQAHGSPRDTHLLSGNRAVHNGQRPHQLSQAGALSAREYSSRQPHGNNDSNHPDRRQNVSGRRSWDFADGQNHNGYDEDPDFQGSNLKKYDRRATHYKSTEVISTSKPLVKDSDYILTSHTPHNAHQSNKNGTSGTSNLTLQEQSQALSAKFKSMHMNNGSDIIPRYNHDEITKQPSHIHPHNALPNFSSSSSSSTSHAKPGSNAKGFGSNGNSTTHPPNHRQPYQKDNGRVYSKDELSKQQHHDRHQLHPPHAHLHPPQHPQSQTNGQGGEVVKLRPVPMSRANRNARGRTLPGGFRFTDAEIAAAGGSVDGQTSGSSQHSKQLGQDPGQEVMLFHLIQKFDLCPLLINLPRHVSLRELADLSEFLVEISLVGVPGIGGSPLGGPNSPQGPVASKIGSPGSAFSPVRNSQDFEGSGSTGALADPGKTLAAKVKVLRFSRVWVAELQRHTTLGRLLEGDIVVEVNGWFCLGADVTYLAQVVESCQGAITFTVARPKESEDKRFKGQLPVERVKGLEAEISRLDEIIHAKDEKIREMTSSRESLTSQQGAITAINGEVPVEGMVIGEDEYVV